MRLRPLCVVDAGPRGKLAFSQPAHTHTHTHTRASRLPGRAGVPSSAKNLFHVKAATRAGAVGRASPGWGRPAGVEG